MKTKRFLVFLLTIILLLGLVACSDGEKDKEGDQTLRVALMLNGNLGDKSFNDSADNGMKMVKEKLENVEVKVVEMTNDDTKWEPAILDVVEEGYDIIISGTWMMQEIFTRVTPDYPDHHFIIYDSAMDHSDGGFSNVYSIEYKQNDGSFLAGVVAASLSETGHIGFVGGMDNIVIMDFLVGYIQGAKTINPDIRVASSFVGDFIDAARAKELALSQYEMGVDIIFSCAATAGDGTMQAAKELGKYAIGVDSDQAILYKDVDPELAELIPTSVLKRVDISLFQAIEAASKGELKWGTRVAVGIPEDGIGLADNDIYQKVVPEETRKLVDDYTEKIKSGEIEVVTAFNMDNDELLKYVDDAK